MKKYVIIGNGVAAAGCIEGIRNLDRDGRIIVISEEKHAVYCRPLISYYLEGKTDLERMNYRSTDFYDKMNCEVIYGKKAVKADNKTKTVILDDGTAVTYDSVCIATGSAPFIPQFEGIDNVKNKFSFMTIDDASALEEAVNKNSKVLIIGAGLIGLKCAEGLKNRASEITVCDISDRILSSILDADSAEIMQKHIEKNGIKFILGDSAESFSKNTAIMKSGKRINFDVLVLAVGVRANTSIVNEIGGEVNRGIVVNERMETTLPDIYAAGDCTEGNDISLGQKRVLALLPNAYMQGRCAGINMSGGNEMYNKAIPINSIGFFGLHAMTAGNYSGEVYEEKTETGIKKLFVSDGLLSGYILIGNTDRAGIYTSLVRDRVPLDSIDFEMLKKVTTLSIFPQETRRKMLGGVV